MLWSNEIGLSLWMNSSGFANILAFKKQIIYAFPKYLLLIAGESFLSGTSEDKDQSKLRNIIPSLAQLD